MAEPASMDDEPWKTHAGGAEVKYLPMQAEVGDYALFFRKAAVELTFEGKTYLVVPQAAILVLVKEDPGGGGGGGTGGGGMAEGHVSATKRHPPRGKWVPADRPGAP